MTTMRITLKNGKEIALAIDPTLVIDTYRAFRTSPKTWFVSRDNVHPIAEGKSQAAAWKAAAEKLTGSVEV